VSRHDPIAYGLHSVRALLERHPERVRLLWVEAGREDDPRLRPLLERARSAGVAIESVQRRTLDKRTEGGRHQGLLAHLRPAPDLGEADLFQAVESLPGPALFLALDQVQDPHNLGACLRSADAAGAHGVIVPRDRACPLTPAARKAASGAAETVPLYRVANLARALEGLARRGVWTVGLAAEADALLYDMDLTVPTALVLGAEGKGLRRLTRERCDHLARLPMAGTVESLNVSVTAGIALFEAVRQRLVAPSTGGQ